ncbi:MAG: AAA family ATPase [Methylococcales bacterium]|nr:AAA family ATPase [Methylococcales bacterium]
MTEQTGTHFLTDIEIKQFKCFADFKASGFKRVNLIGGKNNVGKTAFMEACYINVRSKDIAHMVNAIISVKIQREFLNLATGSALQEKDLLFFLDYYKNYKAKSNLNFQSFSISLKELKKEYIFCVGNESININSNEISILNFIINEKNDNINFLGQFKLQDVKLIELFKNIQKNDKENELNSFIREFDNSIEIFKVIDKPQCKTNGEYRDITEFGDGLKHYISIICALYACENGYLFIDEIDNGIYYDHLDRLWEIILTLSKKTNCQIFATTHSKEMLESFARVAKKLDEQDISYTLLVKNKNQEIKSITRDYEMILDSIADERELRGW